MIFLIEYDRRQGRLIKIEAFPDAQRRSAQDGRLKLELELHRQSCAHEVVLLEAASESDVRRTHARYFHSVSKLMASLQRALER